MNQTKPLNGFYKFNTKNPKKQDMINDVTNIIPVESTAIYNLPKFLGQIQHITTVDTGGLEFVICCDRMKLYIFPLIVGSVKPLGSVHQSLPIPNIKSLRTIAKNYLMIETQNKYIGIFQIIKSTSKEVSTTQKPVNPIQANAVKVEFSEVLKWRLFSCYFIRQVMQNLFEVQVFFTDLEFEIFQFTIKNKRGSMSFTIAPNGKILKANKKQLYGSKSFFNIGRKLMYWLKNFSDKQFILQEIIHPQPLGTNKLISQPFGYFGIQRAEEYKSLYANLIIRDCINPAKRYTVKMEKESFLNELKLQVAQLSPTKKRTGGQQNPFNELVEQSSTMDNVIQILQSYKITTFTDFFMVENRSKKQMEIYQIKAEAAELVGKEDSRIIPSTQSKQGKSGSQNTEGSLLQLKKWEWYFGNSKKLIGIDRIGFRMKYIQQISLQEKTEYKIKTQAQIITLLQKIDEKDKAEQPETKQQQVELKPAQKMPENEEPKQSQNQKVPQDEDQQQTFEHKRKFSKDELQKFCQEFKDEDADKYVSKDLIKKVDEVNGWVKNQVSSIQKYQNTIKGLNFKTENSKSKTLNSEENQQKKVEPEKKTQQNSQNSKNSPQQNLNPSNVDTAKKISDETTKKQPQILPEQEGASITLKEKPPMKIIQRNKISVAKTSTNSHQGTEAKANSEEEGLSQQVKKEIAQLKEYKQNQKQQQISKAPQINSTQTTKKSETGLSNSFSKYRLNEDGTRVNFDNNGDQEKRRFMKNYLNQQKKDESDGVQQTIQIKTNENQLGDQKQQKDDKIKFNVITRATLLKKKQTLIARQTQTLKEENHQIAISIDQTNKTATENKEIQSKSEQNFIDTKKQSGTPSEQEQKISETQPEPQNGDQAQPKTKFIASIDVKKASKNQLNNCDFLSEDSVSDDDQVENKQNSKQKQNTIEKEESIEEQIEGEQNAQSSIEQQEDLEHLIDDDISTNKKSLNDDISLKIDSKKPSTKLQVNPDQEIQRFCYTLLDEEAKPAYHKKQSFSAVTKQKLENNPIQKVQIIAVQGNPQKQNKTEISGLLFNKSHQSIQQKKQQQDDQMNKFNSLLFKTNIKRTNIFSQENPQVSENKQEKDPLNDSKTLKKDEDFVKIPQVQIENKHQCDKLEQVNPVQKKTSQQQQPLEQKKSKHWHQYSSESNENDEQKQIDPTTTISQVEHIKQKQTLQQEKTITKVPSEKQQTIISTEKLGEKDKNSEIYSTTLKEECKSEKKTTEQARNPQDLADETKKIIKNPYIDNQRKTEDSKNCTKVESNANSNPFLTKSTPSQSISPAELFVNAPVNWLSNRPPASQIHKKDSNPFVNFKKNNHENQQKGHQNLFGTPPLIIAGGSNSSNLFKKFLNQREIKNAVTKQEQKSVVSVIDKSSVEEKVKIPNEIKIEENKPQKSQIKELLENLSEKPEKSQKKQKIEKPQKQKPSTQKAQKQQEKKIDKSLSDRPQKSDKPEKIEIIQKPATLLVKPYVVIQPTPSKKTQISKKQDQLTIPTSALPEIQQLISKYEKSTIQLLQKQEKLILKSLQDIPQTHNPYNKNNSLIVPQQIKEEIIKQSKISVKKWLSTKMLDKIETSFKEIMQEHKSVYEEALKYYENEARRKITTMQLQYEQQSSILVDIENVSANMCAALQSTILEGEELHAYQLKQWKREIEETQSSLIDPLAQKVDDSRSYFEHRNKNLQSMTSQLREIKDILKEKLRKKQELNDIKQKKRQEKQEKLKKRLEQELNRQNKIKQESKKNSKKRKPVQQVERHSSFDNYPAQRQQQYETGYYGRPPYPYY